MSGLTSAADFARRMQIDQHMVNASMIGANPAIFREGIRYWSLEEKIYMRLNITTPTNNPFVRLTADAFDGRVVIFALMANGKHVTLEDDKDLFPSDTLVTQLRILIA